MDAHDEAKRLRAELKAAHEDNTRLRLENEELRAELQRTVALVERWKAAHRDLSERLGKADLPPASET